MVASNKFSTLIIIVIIIISGLVHESVARRRRRPTLDPSVQCPRDIAQPANSYMFMIGNYIRFLCHVGYTRNGPERIVCNTGSTEWSHSPPTCDEQPRCPTLQPPPEVVMQQWNNNQLVTFSCPQGILQGPSNLICQNGAWNGDIPICYIEPPRVCQDPGEPSNGYKFGSNFNEDGVVTFGCYSGYHLMGQERIRCYHRGDDYVWTGRRPRCRRIEPLRELAHDLSNVVDTFSMYTSTNESRGRLAAYQPNGLDIVLMYDISSSISQVDFKRGVNFTIFLLEKIGLANSPNATRVAAVTFGTEAEIVFDFDAHNSLEDIVEALNQIEANGGGTAMITAFMKVQWRLANKMREKAKRVLFFLSDGQSTEEGSVAGPAGVLRRQYNVEIFAIGIGNDVVEQELRNAATPPYATHILSFQNFEELQEVMDLVLETKPEYERCGLAGSYEIGEDDRDQDQIHESNSGAWPWLVNIFDHDNLDPVCGGALICDTWILTAASCLEHMRNGQRILLQPNQITVTVGRYDLFAWNEVSVQKADVVQTIVRHPNYNPEDLSNNLALIELPANVTLNKFVRSVCVPQGDSVLVLTGTSGLSGNAWVAGWGTTGDPSTLVFEVPKQQELLIQGRIQCDRWKPTNVHFGSDMFCAGERTNTYDACRGDLGGPLVQRQENDYFSVIGVSSHNAQCDQYMKVGLFTSVLPHVGWIHNITENCNTASNCEVDC